MPRPLLLALAAISLALLASLALARPAGAFLYWANAEGGAIGRAGLNGEHANQSFIEGLDEPTNIAIAGGYIYWTEPHSEGGPNGSIGRAHLDGSDVEPRFIGHIYEPNGIAISGERIYWGEVGGIGYANIDGTGFTSEAYGTTGTASSIAAHGDYLYFLDTGNNYQVNRLDLESRAVETVFNEENGWVLNSVAVGPRTVGGDGVYWTGCTEGPGVIGDAEETGANADASLITLEEPVGCSLGVTVGDGHIYFTEDFISPEGIGRSNLQGGDVERGIVTGAVHPVGLALTEPPALTGEASTGTALGGAVSDLATLAGGAEPTGTLTYRLYPPGDSACSGSPVYTDEVPVAGNGAYHSPSFTPTAGGTYHWTVSYSGDANNEPATDGCDASAQSVTVTGAPITIVSTPAPANPAKQCTSGRLERIHWRLAPGVSVKSIHVTVNRKLYRTLSGAAREVTVSFKGRRSGTVTVGITGLTASRTRYSATRVYHLCSPRHEERQVRNDTLR